MAYLTNDDLIARVGTVAAVQLTTDSGAEVDTDVLDEARLGAEGEANGYLAKRYQVPVNLTEHADLAATLKSMVLDLAVYKLMGRRPPVPPDQRTAREDAVKWFERISEGKIVLPAAVTPASTSSDDPPPTWGSSPSTGLGGEDGISHF